MPDTAAQQLRRIFRIIPEIADGQEHDLEEIAARAGVSKNTLLSDLRSIADRYTAPGGFVEGVQIFLGPETVEVASDHFLRPMGLTVQ